MSGPAPPVAPARLEPLAAALIGSIGSVLIAGYVVLAALGRDTSGFLLFLASPAITSIVGVVLTRRVGQVSAAVAVVSAQGTQLSDVELPQVHSHLDAQDQALDVVLEAVAGEGPAPAAPDPRLPGPRGAGQPPPDARQPLHTLHGGLQPHGPYLPGSAE